MKLNSVAFGEIEYDEKDIIFFGEGLYGLSELKNFLYIKSEDDDFPFDYLQSIENVDISFIITSPFLFLDDYDFELSESVVEKLEIKNIEDVVVLTITNVSEEVEQTTVNLQAPIIINKSARKAKQVILDESFNHKQYIFKKNESEEKC